MPCEQSADTPAASTGHHSQHGVSGSILSALVPIVAFMALLASSLAPLPSFAATATDPGLVSQLKFTDPTNTSKGAGEYTLDYLLRHYSLFSFGDATHVGPTVGAIVTGGDFSTDRGQVFGQSSLDGIHSFIGGRLTGMAPAGAGVPTVFLSSRNAVEQPNSWSQTVNGTTWWNDQSVHAHIAQINDSYIDLSAAKSAILGQSHALCSTSQHLTIADDGTVSVDGERTASITLSNGVLSVPSGGHFVLDRDTINHITNIKVVYPASSAIDWSGASATVISSMDDGTFLLPTEAPNPGQSGHTDLIFDFPNARTVESGGWTSNSDVWKANARPGQPSWWNWNDSMHYNHDSNGFLVAPQAHFERLTDGQVNQGLIVASADLNHATIIAAPYSNPRTIPGTDPDYPYTPVHPHDSDDPDTPVTPSQDEKYPALYLSLASLKKVNGRNPLNGEKFWFGAEYYNPVAKQWQATHTLNGERHSTDVDPRQRIFLSKDTASTTPAEEPESPQEPTEHVHFTDIPLHFGKNWIALYEMQPNEETDYAQPSGYRYDATVYWLEYTVNKSAAAPVTPRATATSMTPPRHTRQKTWRNSFFAASEAAHQTGPEATADSHVVLKRTIYQASGHADITRSNGDIDLTKLSEVAHKADETDLIDVTAESAKAQQATSSLTNLLAANDDSDAVGIDPDDDGIKPVVEEEPHNFQFDNARSGAAADPIFSSLSASKKFDGGRLTGRDFDFTLAAEATDSATGQEIVTPTVSNGRTECSGTTCSGISFQIRFSAPGTYRYVMSEKSGSWHNRPTGSAACETVRYDSRQYEARVVVGQAADGTLSVTSTQYRPLPSGSGTGTNSGTNEDGAAWTSEAPVFENALMRTILPEAGGIGMGMNARFAMSLLCGGLAALMLAALARAGACRAYAPRGRHATIRRR